MSKMQAWFVPVEGKPQSVLLPVRLWCDVKFGRADNGSEKHT